MRTMRIPALAGALVLAMACGKKDNAATSDTVSMGAPDPMPTPAAGPIRVSDVMIGKAIGSDKRVTDAMDDFAVRDTIYASVVTEGAATGAKLTTKWTFNDKQVVKETSQNISPSGGTTVTEFHIDKKSAWPKGKYKVEVMLDGVSAQTKDFEVK
ncbi:MAG TPA: hypothetical protein VNJ04_00780 [Gemmatimonadaceae bacterium]|nr:hypothetical protein [Gemmatimonadaceae bacterium]